MGQPQQALRQPRRDITEHQIAGARLDAQEPPRHLARHRQRKVRCLPHERQKHLPCKPQHHACIEGGGIVFATRPLQNGQLPEDLSRSNDLQRELLPLLGEAVDAAVPFFLQIDPFGILGGHKDPLSRQIVRHARLAAQMAVERSRQVLHPVCRTKIPVAHHVQNPLLSATRGDAPAAAGELRSATALQFSPAPHISQCGAL